MKNIHIEIAIIHLKGKSVGKLGYSQPFVTFVKTTCTSD